METLSNGERNRKVLNPETRRGFLAAALAAVVGAAAGVLARPSDAARAGHGGLNSISGVSGTPGVHAGHVAGGHGLLGTSVGVLEGPRGGAGVKGEYSGGFGDGVSGTCDGLGHGHGVSALRRGDGSGGAVEAVRSGPGDGSGVDSTRADSGLGSGVEGHRLGTGAGHGVRGANRTTASGDFHGVLGERAGAGFGDGVRGIRDAAGGGNGVRGEASGAGNFGIRAVGAAGASALFVEGQAVFNGVGTGVIPFGAAQSALTSHPLYTTDSLVLVMLTADAGTPGGGARPGVAWVENVPAGFIVHLTGTAQRATNFSFFLVKPPPTPPAKPVPISPVPVSPGLPPVRTPSSSDGGADAEQGEGSGPEESGE